MKRIIAIFIATVTLGMLHASAQTASMSSAQVLIKGVVVDSIMQEPMIGATLKFSTDIEGNDVAVTTVCGFDGDFATSLPYRNEYFINVSSIGMKPKNEKIAIPQGATEIEIPTIYLTNDTQMLSEVTVTAQKTLVKMEVDKLSYRVDEDPDSKVSNTLDMLKKVPMVTVDADDNIQLKGSGKFVIYMNGRPSGLLSQNPSEVLKGIPASSIKSIEVITDPGSKYDAEGIEGIINIVMAGSTIDGYTANISLGASSVDAYSAGAFISLQANKLGLTANYNYENEREPEAAIESIRENFSDNNAYWLRQTGEQWEKEYSHQGYLQASYEIDSLNLVTLDATLYRKNQREYSDYEVGMYDINNNLAYGYNRSTRNNPVMGAFELNANYQHETHRPGEILTLSYRFTNVPGDDENCTFITPILNYNAHSQWDTNNARTNEHTFQIDYQRAIWGEQSIETGGKYILRQSSSEISHFNLDQNTGNWVEQPEQREMFDHTQHIYALYLGANLKFNQWSVKAGVRAEGTSLDTKFDYEPNRNFDSNFIDIVPNATLAYSLSQSQQLKLGYNMRIQRAGIAHLNPYIDQSDPYNISYGNPQLKSEKSHSLNLNYALLLSKLTLNLTASHSFVNNSIEEITFMEPKENIAVTTYDNVGSRRLSGLALYVNYTPIDWLRVYTNGGLEYLHLENKYTSIANHGWSGSCFAGIQFALPYSWRINAYLGYKSKQTTIQGYRSDFLTNSFTVSKELFNDNLTVSVFCKSPFSRTWEMKNVTQTPDFNLCEIEHKVMREFGVTVSWRFGNMNKEIKTVKRGIVNDDVISSEED